LVGYEMDRINGCCGLPKRKSWHLLGFLSFLYYDDDDDIYMSFLFSCILI